MLQDEIAWDQAQAEGNEILAEYPTQNLDRREKKCYDDTRVIVAVDLTEDATPIYMSISANRPRKYGTPMSTTEEVNYEVLEPPTFQLDV